MKMSRKLAFILGLGMAVLIHTTEMLAGEKADYVFKNAAIYTIDAKNPTAQAIAITGKYITYVGTNEGVQPFVGEKTEVIDLHGQMLLPGFVDSHIHPTLAMFAGGADLQFDSVEEVLASVKKWAEAHPDEKVVRGYGWRYTLFPTTGPTKLDLDRLFPDRPVLLVAIDVHSAWVNSRALELAGIDAKTPDPVPGFSIYQRDPKTGEPTGWLVETPAEQAVLAKLTPPTPEAQMAATAELLPQLSAVGITAVFEAGIATMPTETGYDGYQQLREKTDCRLGW